MKRIINNPYVLSIVSKTFGVIIGLIFTIFQARFLGPEIKGQVATVNSIVSITSIIFGFGIYNAYPFYKRKNEPNILELFLRLSFYMLIIYSLISVVVILLFHLSAKYYAVFMLTPLLIYDSNVSYITLIEVPNKRSLVDILIDFFELLLLIVICFFVLPSFFIGIIIIFSKVFIKALLLSFLWRKRFFISTDSLQIWIPKLLKFGFFPMLSLLMSTLNYRLDVLMLNGKVPDASIGVYSVGVLLAERIWLIPDALKGVMVSNISKGRGADETAYIIRISITVCFIIAIIIALFGKIFVNFVFGSEYVGAYNITLILLVGVFPMVYYKLISSFNIVMGKQVINFIFLCIGVIVNIIANSIMIPLMGIIGAGVSSVVSYLICSIFFIVYFCSHTNTSFLSVFLLQRADLNRLVLLLSRKRRDL